MRDRVAFLLAVTCLAAGLAGCGSGSAKPVSTPGPAEQLLTPADVNAYPAGSPAHALLAWWRDAQYANLVGFEQALAPSLRGSFAPRAKLADAVQYFAGAIQTARPKIDSVSQSGKGATVYTRVVYRNLIGTSKYVTTTSPHAFAFELVQGRWLLLDDLFVETTLPASLRPRA